MRKTFIALACSLLLPAYVAWAQDNPDSNSATDTTNLPSDQNQAGVAQPSDQAQASGQITAPDQTGAANQQPGVAEQQNVPQENLPSPNQQPGISEQQNMAQENAPNANQQPGEVTNQENVTATSEAEVGRKGIGAETIGIKPQVGWVNFRDASNSFTGRALYGLNLDFNVSNAFAKLMGASPVFIGPSTGVFYSHIGAVGTNFFGSNTSVGSGEAGANFFFLPLDLKVGWNVGPFRLAVHGGGNVMYQSVPNSVILGINPSGSNWTMLPNVGADVEFGAANALAVIARPDWTISGSNRVYALTVGLSFPLG